MQDSEKYKPGWYSWDFQKQKILDISVQLYTTYDGVPYDECVVEAKSMIDQYYKDVINPETRKW